MSVTTTPGLPVVYPPAETPQSRLGWDAGQPALYEEWGIPSPYPKRPLSFGEDGLPELAPEKIVARKMWRHPAFIVSIVTTVGALGTAAVLLIMGVFGTSGATVTNLAITGGEGNVHLTWDGADTAYDLFVIPAGSEEVVDVSQLVHGKEAWVPRYADLIDDNSCFIVRAADVESTKVAADPGTLEEQGAKTICVDDAEG